MVILHYDVKKKAHREAVTYGRYKVGGGGGHSGSGGGRGIPECLSEKGPHHSIAGEKQPATQQPQRDMELKNRENLRPSSDVRFMTHLLN